MSRRASRATRVLTATRARDPTPIQEPKSCAETCIAPALARGPHAVPTLAALKASSMPRAATAIPRLRSARACGPARPLAGRRGTPLPPQHRLRSTERSSEMLMSTSTAAAPSISNCSSATSAVVVDPSTPMIFSAGRRAPRPARPYSKWRRDLLLSARRTGGGRRDQGSL